MGPAGGTWKGEGKDGSGRVREEVDSERVWVVPKECRLKVSDAWGKALVFRTTMVLKINNFKVVKKAMEENFLCGQD